MARSSRYDHGSVRLIPIFAFGLSAFPRPRRRPNLRIHPFPHIIPFLPTSPSTIRGQKVILDADLAALYEVSTKALNQAVKRNAERFPSDFAFILTPEEKSEVVTNCDHLARLRFSPALPRAFTEHGALMAATILNSPRAVLMSVYVVRVFVKMRQNLAANAAILKRLAEIDKTLLVHDGALRDVYQKLRPLLEPPPTPPKPEIGFHVKEEPPPYGGASCAARTATGKARRERMAE